MKRSHLLGKLTHVAHHRERVERVDKRERDAAVATARPLGVAKLYPRVRVRACERLQLVVREGVCHIACVRMRDHIAYLLPHRQLLACGPWPRVGLRTRECEWGGQQQERAVKQRREHHRLGEARRKSRPHRPHRPRAETQPEAAPSCTADETTQSYGACALRLSATQPTSA